LVLDKWQGEASNEEVDALLVIAVIGLAVGVLYGLFGVGAAFATPLLALAGVPGLVAVVTPLPGLLPGSALGAWSYSRDSRVDWRIARRAIVGGVPAAVVGAFLSHIVGGPVLLGLSGVVLLGVGIRIVTSDGRAAPTARALDRSASVPFVVGAAVVVGFAAGLLANGGGFLLVPLFLLALGLDMKSATGTSLVVAAAFTIPTLLTHAVIGDVDWLVAGAFAVGIVPGALVGSGLSKALPSARLRWAFGVLLVGFAAWFLVRQATTIGL
jgi:uncharacterized membrane protein YfcA